MLPRLMLYNYWRSSSSQRVRIALALKGLDYEYVAVDLRAGEHASSPHKARSPTGYVPCLSIEGTVYVESVAILELLEERFPSPPLYPNDAHGRARVRALVEIVNSGIQPLQNLAVLHRVSKDAEEQGKWAAHFNARGLESFEGALAAVEREGVGGPFSYGAAPMAADVCLVPQVFSARRFGVDVAPLRRVSRVFDAAMQLEAFRKAVPEVQPDAPNQRA
jgi:maleylacetoacetate isomerase